MRPMHTGEEARRWGERSEVARESVTTGDDRKCLVDTRLGVGRRDAEAAPRAKLEGPQSTAGSWRVAEPESRYRVAIKRPLAQDEPAVGISLDN